MLVKQLTQRRSYKAVNTILNGAVLHDLQGIDVLTMIANKKAIVIYDTGTGKTLLAAAVMKLLIRENPGRIFLMFVKHDQLVQTPAKLKSFAGLNTLATSADSKILKNNFFGTNLEEYNVIMLTHECLHNTSVLDTIYEIKDKIAGIIIDEAHEYNNYNNAESASVLKAMVHRFEYVFALTATPIISDLMQLARLANLVDSNKFPNASILYENLLNRSYRIEADPWFFINRKAEELGRTSKPKGYVISVEPQHDQRGCTLGGVELFQVCKGDGAINQVKALEELIKTNIDAKHRGLVYISQQSILRWVVYNLQSSGIRFACINSRTKLNERSLIEEKFARGEYDVVLTSITTAIDLDCEYVAFYEFTVMVSQMIGRAHRGLKPKDLDIFFIITKDTNEVDYFINNIYEKCQIVKNILGKDNDAVNDVANSLGVD